MLFMQPMFVLEGKQGVCQGKNKRLANDHFYTTEIRLREDGYVIRGFPILIGLRWM